MPILLIIAAVLLASASPAAAQSWPSRSMTLVVPLAAGGASDAIARIIADGLRIELRQSVVVQNISGAGGMVGSSRVAKAAPDGYEMVLGNIGTHAQNQSLYRKPPYDVQKDFAPVALVTHQSLFLVARKDFPADDLQTFIGYVRTNQATLKFASAGVGGSNHLACALLNSVIGVEVTHIPYRGAAQAMQDTLAGRIDYQCPSAPVALPQIGAKTVKPIAILSKNRSPSLPDLASAHEQGLMNFDVPSWYALFLPSGTPVDIVQKLNRATVSALNTPPVQRRLKEIGSDLITPEQTSPEYLGKFVAAEIEKWGRVIKASNIQLD